jgi:hypothetical protein
MGKLKDWLDIKGVLFLTLFLVLKVRKMKCPKCKRKIKKLKCVLLERTQHDFDGFYTFDRVIESKPQYFKCPFCKEILFTEEKDAIKFLKGGTKNESTSRKK